MPFLAAKIKKSQIPPLAEQHCKGPKGQQYKIQVSANSIGNQKGRIKYSRNQRRWQEDLPTGKLNAPQPSFGVNHQRLQFQEESGPSLLPVQPRGFPLNKEQMTMLNITYANQEDFSISDEDIRFCDQLRYKSKI